MHLRHLARAQPRPHRERNGISLPDCETDWSNRDESRPGAKSIGAGAAFNTYQANLLDASGPSALGAGAASNTYQQT